MFRSFYCFKKFSVRGLKNRIRLQREQQKRKDFCLLEAWDMLVLMIYSSVKVIHEDALSA